MYKASRYNYFCELNDNYYLLFNSFSGAIIKIGTELKSKLLLNLKELSEQEIITLGKMGIIIPEEMNEIDIIEFDRSKGVYCTDTVTYRILTTTACNARCSYCYEERKNFESMTSDTADAVVKFIIKQTAFAKKIKIQWFGGEPVLNIDVMIYITSRLREYANLNLKTIEFSMITNGSLIHLLPFKELSLSRVQISLDGENDEYCLRKNFYDKKICLEQIIENIKLLLSLNILVSVRLNYDKNNYESICNLIRKLGREFTNKQYLRVYPYPLFGTYNGHKECKNGTTPDQLYVLYQLLYESGLIKKTEFINLGYRRNRCFACNANSFVISPGGQLFKCTTDFDHSMGSVFTGVTYNTAYFKWVNTNISEECKECIFLPICQGGCMAGQNSCHPVKCFLKKDIIDNILLEQINK